MLYQDDQPYQPKYSSYGEDSLQQIAFLLGKIANLMEKEVSLLEKEKEQEQTLQKTPPPEQNEASGKTAPKTGAKPAGLLGGLMGNLGGLGGAGGGGLGALSGLMGGLGGAEGGGLDALSSLLNGAEGNNLSALAQTLASAGAEGEGGATPNLANLLGGAGGGGLGALLGGLGGLGGSTGGKAAPKPQPPRYTGSSRYGGNGLSPANMPYHFNPNGRSPRR